ncbi:Rnase Y domain-containing protein, partial [Paenibacillus xylanexedens]|uniref:Rnase Y domain-containing protein n=1 Tax=Paenibacillus xylanexedens TaxID=528191 RepID=UPI003F78D856
GIWNVRMEDGGSMIVWKVEEEVREETGEMMKEMEEEGKEEGEKKCGEIIRVGIEGCGGDEVGERRVCVVRLGNEEMKGGI